jgi:cold-inducible RNA-binding protein
MESKLYVGNLPYSTTEDKLRELFTKAGTVTSVSVITDRETGRSKGFAFVEMSNQSEAEKAIQMFNGYSMDNRELRVSIARPKEERPSGGYGGSRGSSYGNKGGNRSRGGTNSNRY